MKKLLIVFIILPFVSIAQMDKCIIESFITYAYDLDYINNKVIDIKMNDISRTKFEIFKYGYKVTYDDKTKRTIRWTYSRTNNPDTYTYYTLGPFDSKMVLYKNQRKINCYYNYNKEIDAYTSVIVYIY